MSPHRRTALEGVDLAALEATFRAEGPKPPTPGGAGSMGRPRHRGQRSQGFPCPPKPPDRARRHVTQRRARPGVRRVGASSRTSSADPGEPGAEKPQRRTAVLTFAAYLTPEQRGEAAW